MKIKQCMFKEHMGQRRNLNKIEKYFKLNEKKKPSQLTKICGMQQKHCLREFYKRRKL